MGETDRSNEYGETRNEGIKYIGKSRGVLKEKLGRHSNAWPVYQKCGERAYWWRREVSMAVEGRAERRE